MSGPEELRRSAIQSVLQWHFMKDAAGSTRQVSIAYELPKEGTPQTGVAGGVVGGVSKGVEGGVSGGVLRGEIRAVPQTATAPPPPSAPAGVLGGMIGSVPANAPLTIGRIETAGLSEQARTELLSQIPVREGDTVTREQLNKVREAVRAYDSHLSVGIGSTSGGTTLRIAAPGAFAARDLSNLPVPAGAIRVGGNVQQTKLTMQPRPVYPPLAKQARIQGSVSLQAVIGKDGHVQNLQVISGHPLLVQAALDAVKDWVYQPTLLNGNPVEVVTVIDVNFTLSE